MKALAGFVMKGQMQAALVVACFAVLAALVPPIVVFSGAALALVVLRRGSRDGVVVAAIATAGGAVISWFAVGSPQFVLIVAAAIWLPTCVCALILRATVSLSLVLRVLAVMAVLPVLGVFLVLGDPAVWWGDLMRQAAPVLLQELGAQIPADLLHEQIEALAPRFTGVLVSQGVALVLISLLLGRWWQSQLYNPGGFGAEFRAIALGKPFAIGVLVVFGFASFAPMNLLTNLTVAMSVVLAMFGLAIVHNLVNKTGGRKGWLLATYVLLALVIYPVLTLLSVLGAADTWLGLRERVAARPGSGQ